MRPGFVNGQKIFGMCSPIGEHPLMHKVKKVCTNKKPCKTGYNNKDPLPLTCETFLGGFGMEHGSAMKTSYENGAEKTRRITTWKHPETPDEEKTEGMDWVKAIAKGTQDALPKTSTNAVAYTCARVFVSHLYDPAEDVEADCSDRSEGCTYRFGTAYQIVQGMVVECHSTTETVYPSPKMTCTDSKMTKSCYETTYKTKPVKDDVKGQLVQEAKDIRAILFKQGVANFTVVEGTDKTTAAVAAAKASKSWTECKSVNKMKLTSSG